MMTKKEKLGSYGISSYTELRSKNRTYIDKTRVIELLDESGTDHAVLYRPRRFGKSLLTTMLTAYYDEAAKSNFQKNFSQTYIGANPTSEQGMYRVLSFDLSGNDTFSWKVILGIRDYISRYPDSLFNELRLAPEESPSNLLNRFFDILFRREKVSLFVIIDEYDQFCNEVLSQNKEIFKRLMGAGGEVKDFFTTIKAATKHFVSRSFITGVLPISLDSLTSGFNISENVTRVPMMAAALGFTENDVRTLIRDMLNHPKDSPETDNLIRKMKVLFNGYRFCPNSPDRVYNPSMCLYFLKSLQRDSIEPDVAMDPAIVADKGKITQILSLVPSGVMSDIVQKVLSGKPFALENGHIGDPINLNLISTLTESNVISILWYMGFLTYSPQASGKFICPNKIMRKQFCSVFLAKSGLDFDPNFDNVRDVLLHLRNGNVSAVFDYVSERLDKGSGIHSSAGLNEKAIQIAIYMIADLSNDYTLKMEYEAFGKGFSDLCLERKSESGAANNILIEVKFINANSPGKERIEEQYETAAAQLLKYYEAERNRLADLKLYAVVFARTKVALCREVLP